MLYNINKNNVMDSKTTKSREDVPGKVQHALSTIYSCISSLRCTVSIDILDPCTNCTAVPSQEVSFV